MIEQSIFITADATARAAEREQVAANKTSGAENPLVVLDSGNNILAALAPGYELVFSPRETPIVQASGAIQGIAFTARKIGSSGNGTVVSSAQPTELEPVTSSTPSDQAFGSIGLYAVRNFDALILAEVVDAGAAGMATYRYSINGGAFGAPVTVPMGSPTLAAPFTFTFTTADARATPPTPLLFRAGDLFNFLVVRKFGIVIQRGELSENWGASEIANLPNYARGSLLISNVSGTELEPGSVILRGGSGGSISAVTERLQVALELPSISAATRARVSEALKSLAD